MIYRFATTLKTKLIALLARLTRRERQTDALQREVQALREVLGEAESAVIIDVYDDEQAAEQLAALDADDLIPDPRDPRYQHLDDLAAVLNVPTPAPQADDVVDVRFLLPQPEPKPVNGEAICLPPTPGNYQWMLSHAFRGTDMDPGVLWCARCGRAFPE
jgi:hypothetical protein